MSLSIDERQRQRESVREDQGVPERFVDKRRLGHQDTGPSPPATDTGGPHPAPPLHDLNAALDNVITFQSDMYHSLLISII